MPMLSKEKVKKNLDDLLVKIEKGDEEAFEKYIECIDEYSKVYDLKVYIQKLNDTGVLINGNPFEFY